MKQTSIILLLTLILLPIIWNGVTLFHFVVEHTHTFCQEETTHVHSDTEDCLPIFQLAENQHPNQLPSPTKSEFKDLKQYLTPSFHLSSIVGVPTQAINFVETTFPKYLFSEDIFHPPILA